MHQSMSHNCKGSFSRLADVFNGILAFEDRLMFLEAIGAVALLPPPPHYPTVPPLVIT